MPPMTALPVIQSVVQQHAEESVALRNIRSVLLRAPQVKLRDLHRHDERVAAHLDGLLLAGAHGVSTCRTALGAVGVGEVFVAAVRAIEDRNSKSLDELFALALAVPSAQVGLVSAFGWVSAQFLQGTIKNLLASDSAFQRLAGIAACAMHQVDPASALDAALTDADAALRARSLRVAGESGRQDLLSACVSACSDENAACRFWASRSAVLLGDRHKALAMLKSISTQAGPVSHSALRLVLGIVQAAEANALLKVLAQNPSNIRGLIQGTGISGDPYYIPWLIKQMHDPQLARLAGEAFSWITGLDLACLKLDAEPPGNFQMEPNDDPNDNNVAMDEDDGLSWPDPVKIQKWWDANKPRFGEGVHYFMGKPVTVQNCKQVLREGYQRQRIAAAEYLCLLQPGTHLFPTSAPAWRQQRWLNKMG